MEGNRQTDENGKPIVPVSVDDPYSWVKGEVREMESWFSDMEIVEELGESSLWVREGSNVKVEFLPCGVEERVYHKGKEWDEFEYGVLSQLKCAPTQIHPNAWAFIRGFEILMEYLGQEPQLEVFFSFFQAKGVRKGGIIMLNSCQRRSLFALYRSSYKDFKQMFVKVRSPQDEFPFYLDECLLERFPLYWYAEPVQILGMDEVDEGSAVVIDFLDQYLCSKEPLSLNRVLKWEKEKESVLEYLEKTTGGLKNFFKLRNDRELSTSNVVKTEQGVVVNQPAKKNRPISVKRRHAKDGASDKGKKLHGYVGAEDLSSVWSEHFPLPVVAEEHFQSKADFDLIESVSDIGRAQFMQVYAARMLCIGRYEELKARKEAKRKRNEGDKELLGVKAENEGLKEKVQKLEKDRAELETRVVELCGLKKEVEASKEDHGYEMLLAGFARAKRQAEFFFPEIQFDKLDPIKVVHNGALVDDDEVDLEGGDNHDPEA
ncbi:hypothetical protein PIB30_039084 [Stylosanthes scabra]|uniref:Uncharacterized protein n=1 Tax=Stylosanthes scabra TaxID=79078 RepID=A0ABU6XDE0_9FABA|nr:hypothetical protein [Stylosanthes scabra]